MLFMYMAYHIAAMLPYIKQHVRTIQPSTWRYNNNDGEHAFAFDRMHVTRDDTHDD